MLSLPGIRRIPISKLKIFDHDLDTSSLDRLKEDLECRLGYSLKWDEKVPPTDPRKGFYLTYEHGGISINDHGVAGVTLNYYEISKERWVLQYPNYLNSALKSKKKKQ